LLDDPQLKLFRYEDVILNKAQLMRDICTHFHWPIDEVLIGQILSWADVIPTEERPAEFVRRVLPGDHKNKLSPDVIARIDDILGDSLQVFGYASTS